MASSRDMNYLVALTALVANALGIDYKPITGPSEVASNRNLTIEREGRDRPIEIKATWPKGSGKCPVIVLSHGMGGSKDVGAPLANSWASNGYIVLAPTHLDSFEYMSADQRRQYLAGQSAEFVKHFRSRPEDVTAMIDKIAEIERQEPALKGRMDLTRLGMAGHSFGAHTTMLIAGTELGGLRRMSFADKRFKCALMLSPQGIGGGLTKESWKPVTMPMMVISGTEDKSMMDRDVTPESRQDPYKYSSSKDKFLVWIEGANHGLGGISGVRSQRINAPNSDHLKWVQTASLAFFDGYLADKGEGRSYLASNSLTDLSHNKLTLSR